MLLVFTTLIAGGAGYGVATKWGRGLTPGLGAGGAAVVAFLLCGILTLGVGLGSVATVIFSVAAGVAAVFYLRTRDDLTVESHPAATDGASSSDDTTNPARTTTTSKRPRNPLKSGPREARASRATGPIEWSDKIGTVHFLEVPTLDEIEDDIVRRSNRDRSSVDMAFLRKKLVELIHHVTMNTVDNPNAAVDSADKDDIRVVFDRPDFSTDLLRRQLSHLGVTGAATWQIFRETELPKVCSAMVEAVEMGTYDKTRTRSGAGDQAGVDERTSTAATIMKVPTKEVDLVHIDVPDDIDDTRLLVAAIMTKAGLGLGLWTTKDAGHLLRALARHVPVGHGEVTGQDNAGVVIVPANGAKLLVGTFEGPRGGCLVLVPTGNMEAWSNMFTRLVDDVRGTDVSAMVISQGYTQRAHRDIFLASQCVPAIQVKAELDLMAVQ